MNRKGRGIIGLVAGFVLIGTPAWAEKGPMLNGPGHLSASMESELSSRDMKTGGQKERERVARQSLELTYGLIENLDLYAKVGLGKITFEDADLSSQTRPLTGIGFRSTVPFNGGYFAGLSAQYQFGRVSKFQRNNTTLTIEDKWTEADAALFVGTKDLALDPEPDLRFYTGLRFSSRNDKLPSGTLKQDHSIGGMIGVDFSDRNTFRFTTELGTGDRNNILIRFGIIF
ncbi:MAG: hypothetical protein HY283_06655 [Nitrospirae bacterium]|nr:hypothetical protein [Nitrospirota bacterium]